MYIYIYTSKTTRCHKPVYVLIHMLVFVSNVHLTSHLLGLGPSASLTKADTLTCSPTLEVEDAQNSHPRNTMGTGYRYSDIWHLRIAWV